MFSTFAYTPFYAGFVLEAFCTGFGPRADCEKKGILLEYGFFFVAVLFRARFFLAFTIFTNVADAVTNTAILARSGALSHATVFGRCTFLFKASATV